MSWAAAFPEPIPLPDGEQIRTLKDAGRFIEKLPEAEVAKPAWQTALHVVLQAADHGGPIDFARLGAMRALYPVAPVYDPKRKDPPWRNSRKLARDR
ncbi:hypothetical protein [Tardiphaga sp.]|jgi:hypothetical protein|uniref:hypothetical protein n=1 Tax=Tardiphaga sp. TaxID=1926292 RepID=UPI0037DA475D